MKLASAPSPRTDFKTARSARPTPVRQFALIVLGFCLLSGCSWAPFRKVPLDASTGFYQNASLTYRLDAGKLQQPLDVIRVEGQTISYEQVASSPLPEESIGTLSVTFPHPSDRAGFAEARFELDSGRRPAKTAAKSLNPFKKKPKGPPPASSLLTAHPALHEAWVLDIPSAESDQLFKMLSSQGFYSTDRPGAVCAELTVKINDTELHKDWDQIVELNALVQRVRRQGQLVAYVRPTGADGKPPNSITSTGVYRDLLARRAPTDPQSQLANVPPSAFSLTPVSPPPANTVAHLPAISR